MEQQYNDEIDLLDLIFRICKRWRLMIVMAIICAVMTCGYQVYSNKKASDALTDKLNIKKTSAELQEDLTKKEKEKVAEAVKIYRSVTAEQEYLDNSVYLNIDYYHTNMKVLQYVLEGVKEGSSDISIDSALLNTYSTYISNISELDGIELGPVDLNQLVGAYISNEGVSNSKIDTKASREVLVVIIKGDSQEMTEEITSALAARLEAYSEELSGKYGTHSLTLMDEQSTVGYDSAIEADRSSSMSKINDGKSKLEGMLSAFSQEQKSAYDALSLENELELEDVQEIKLSDDVVKMAVIGIMLGILLVCCYIAGGYIMGGKLRTADNMVSRYHTFLQGDYSLVKVESEGKKVKGIDKLLANIQNPSKLTKDQITQQAITNLQLSMKKVNASNVCMLSTTVLEDSDKELIQNLIGNIGSSKATLYDDCAHDTAGVKAAAQAKYAVLVEKIDVTRMGDVDRLYGILKEYEIQVIGVVVL